eukprot:14645285-Ditylum_brightwellii.AAC.1
MKIDAKSLKFANYFVGNRPPHILFYVPERKEELSPSDYQVYKLWTNPKDKKSAMYLLMVKYYKVGIPEEWLQFIDAIFQSLLRRDALQVFQNKETNQKERDSQAFTKYPGAITAHAFPKKAYTIQKKYIWNICKPLRLRAYKWILHVIKLND